MWPSKEALNFYLENIFKLLSSEVVSINSSYAVKSKLLIAPECALIDFEVPLN